jgi:hypothetical protein
MTIVVIASILVVGALAPVLGVDTRTPELLGER